MTKVTFDPSLLEYQGEMKQALRQVIQHQFIGGVNVRSRAEPPLAQMDLLPPPMIQMLDLDIYNGKIDDVILIETSDDFGIQSLHVMIHDDQGNLIESGEAMDGSDGFGMWGYFAEVTVPSGTAVIVHAAATDSLGGTGVQHAGKNDSMNGCTGIKSRRRTTRSAA